MYATAAPPTSLSLQHLQVELARLNVRLWREVYRWQLAGQDPEDGFRGLKMGDEEAHALLARPFGTSWGQTIDLGPEAEQFATAEAEAAAAAQALVERAEHKGEPLRLVHLARAFGLDRFELDTLLICLAPHLDLKYERLYGYLQDDVTRRRPTVNLVLDLLAEPGPARLPWLARFADDAPLFQHLLLERIIDSQSPQTGLLGQALAVDDGLVSWLLGEYRPHPELGQHATLWPPEALPGDPVLAGDRWPALQPALVGQPPVVVFSGPDEASQHATARLLAKQLGRPLLAVDLPGLASASKPGSLVLRLALRDARLTGAIPYLTGWDACLAGNSGARVSDWLEILCRYPDLVLLSGQQTWQAQGLERDRTLVWLDFPLPEYAQRLTLWQHYLQGAPLARDGEAAPRELQALAGQFMLTTAQVRDAVYTARDHAAQRGEALQYADLFQAARAHSSPGLANLAHKIEPRYGWNDIVLPPDQLTMLREIIATVRGRPIVLETWGVGRKLASSAGVTVLFAGPPGTGKTMAAEVIASELGLDLYRIDLSTVVNKYIGETEKNLGRIFDEASNSNAILFFDEADAIFGKRSEVKDAHDRYANIEVSYLLQRMEAYDGITILATNLRANMDEAFTRRLQFAVDFPFPDEAYRARIWEALFPPGLPRAADIDLGLLARRFKLAGGNIRNIIISAAYQAAADGGLVTMPHLLHGARRELQKMGRLIKEHELTYE